MVSPKIVLRIFLGILVLGIFLRAYNLDAESLWTDEAFSVMHAQQSSPALVIAGIAQTEAAPPGYYLLLHYWMQFLGDMVFMIRLLSVIFSLLAVVMLFLLVRMLLNTNIALLAALFMSVTMLQIEYAQEARLYALFTFLSLASAYFFTRGHKNNDKHNWWWYGLCMLLALYVNYMAFFLMLGFAFILFSRKEVFALHWKKWLRTHFFIGVLGLPLLPIARSQFQIINTGLPQTLIQKGLPAFLANLGIFFFLLPIAAFTLLAAMIISQKKVRNILLWLDTHFFLFILVIGSAYIYLSRNPLIISGIPFIRVPITNSYFLVRHSFFLVPLWYVYLGYKVDQLWSERKKLMAALILLLILFFSFSSLLVYYTQPTKAQWPEVIQFIDENSQSEKVLVLLDKGGQSNEFLFRYYAPEDWLLLRLTWADGWRDFKQIDEDRLLGLLEKTDEFWLVLSKNNRTETYYRDLLDKHYTRAISKEFEQVEVYRYGRKLPTKY